MSYCPSPLSLQSNHNGLLAVAQKILVPFPPQGLCIYYSLCLKQSSSRYLIPGFFIWSLHSHVTFSVKLPWALYLNLNHTLLPTLPIFTHFIFVSGTYYPLICCVIFLFTQFTVTVVCAKKISSRRAEIFICFIRCSILCPWKNTWYIIST